MIYGIGTDIVGVSRLQTNLDRYGERFAARILAESEMAAFRQTQSQAHFLAKRFAAKEALVKALGTGFR
ncbi:MAG TPA: holo-[acyl-carrier-protein] synthase, partial [Chromatiales bacterium]|nr:holo-[acyl-carrier-protein] synthase [Chromatiales bacterium]HEX22459.1 holo-[acyl-carrier-protein] synthase [Chromatiales bacterium]